MCVSSNFLGHETVCVCACVCVSASLAYCGKPFLSLDGDLTAFVSKSYYEKRFVKPSFVLLLTQFSQEIRT